MRTSRRQALKRGTAIVGAGAIGTLSGCFGVFGGGGATVKVGSKRFTEQELLGKMAVVSLRENTDQDITDETGLGGTNTNFQAVKNDEIDLYWEYTGTALLTLPPKHDSPIGDPQETYETVDQEVQDEHGLDFLKRGQFNNTYVLMATKDFVSETGVDTLSKFAEYVNSGNTDMKVLMDAEFQERSDGWPGLADHYGFADVSGDLAVQNMGPGLIYQAMGQGEAPVGMGFNTNPKIVKFDLTVLEDDQQFFPVYNPAPLVRQDTLDEASSIQEPLNAIGPKLSTEKVRSLNKRISIDGEDAETVAEEFLSNNGLI